MRRRHLLLWAPLGIVASLWVDSHPGPNPTRHPRTHEGERSASLADPEVRRLLDDGDYAAAEHRARRTVAFLEADHGPASLEVARALDLLVEALWRGGKARTPEARLLAQRAVDTKRAALGADALDLTASYNNLAIVLVRHGELGRARAAFERSLAIRESVLDPTHPDVVRSLINLANLARKTGEITLARRLYERAIGICEKSPGPTGDSHASALANLADLLRDEGDASGARALLERVLEIHQRDLPPGHPRLALALEQLGSILQETGSAGRARSYLERALEIRRASLGPDHPQVARTLARLAEWHAAAGDLRQARVHWESASAQWEKTQGPDEPLMAEALLDLARVDWAEHAGARAIQHALRAEGILRRRFQLAAEGLSEREALGYGRVRSSGLDLAFSILASEPGLARSLLAADVADELVRSRAVVLEEMMRRRPCAQGGESETVAGLRQSFETARADLARLLALGEEPAEDEGSGKGTRGAAEKLERAERALAQECTAFREATSRLSIGLPDVRAHLPRSAALVSYARYRRRVQPFSYQMGAEAEAAGDVAYMALVIRPGIAVPAVVPLGGAQEVDAVVARWRSEASSPPASAGALDRCRLAGEALRRAVWDPVVPALGDAGLVLVVADGALHGLSFSTLPEASGRYLLEVGPTLHGLDTERDVVGAPATSGDGLLALGAPDFAALPQPSRFEPAVRKALAEERPHAPRWSFRPLPGALFEAEEVASTWREHRPAAGVILLTGGAAGERALARWAPGRRVLHLATHKVAGAETPGDAGRDLAILSGLALAGANRAEPGRGADEDGILTAQEIASLELAGVEWVVLSGCDTALGPVEPGEGVLGLRRAFRAAGARTLILSLWPVGDQATREWARRLHEGRLSGLSTADSVRVAARGMVEARRRAGVEPHPFFWGAFVAVGDWR